MTNTFTQTLTNEQVQKVATTINAVYMMMGITNKYVETVEKITGDTTYTAINLYVDYCCVMTIMGNYEESTEKLFGKVMFGNRISVTNTSKEPERPVSWDALVDFATQCKDKLLEEDEHDPDNGYADWMRENFDQSMLDFMDIPSNKFQLIKVTMKQKFEFEEELETFVLVPVDEGVESYFAESDDNDLDKFKDINGRNRNDICANRDANLSEEDPEFTYTTEFSEKTMEEILSCYDENDLLNYKNFED